MSLLANSNAIESGGYNIDRSLRFRSSASAYLSRVYTSTPADSSGYKKTYSVWVKRGNLTTQSILSNYAATTDYWQILFYADSIVLSDLQGSSYSVFKQSNQVFRDPSSWYHVLVSIDTTLAAAEDRVQIFVNNVRITSWASNTNPSLNAYACSYLSPLGGTFYGRIGSRADGAYYFDGYMAEFNAIDGQALTPSSFGEFSAETGVWVPKKYTGTYGTNGFYLDFKDNTSATTLAYDKSGNGNNWTANNISTTAGATYDSMTDVPTLTSATAANYCVLNPLINTAVSGFAISNGNLTFSTSSTTSAGVTFNIPISGKYYWEAKITALGTGVNLGIYDTAYQLVAGSNPALLTVYGYGYDSSGGKLNNGNTAYGASFTTNDVVGVALDSDAGTLVFYKNGVSQGTAFSSLTGKTFSPYFAANTSTWDVNFGQRPFAYTPPTGFKALNTFNLPDPTIKKPNQYMDVSLYSGNSGTQNITGVGFQPDLVWIKSRSTSGSSNVLTDSVRGVSKILQSDQTQIELNYNADVTSFNSDGFTVLQSASSNLTNVSGRTYVGWQWKESATAGFDIVTYTGNGVTGRTVSHNLGVAPAMIIPKNRSVAGNWHCYHKSLGATQGILLNATNATSTDSGFWNNTAPTSSVFTAGTYNNFNGENYVAYCFAEIPGFSKFGSYTGNGSTDGPFVYCGFRPKYVMIKRTDAANDWTIWDTSRSPFNVATQQLAANDARAELTNTLLDITANGFKVRDSLPYINTNGGTYIYAAFAENPFKYANAR